MTTRPLAAGIVWDLSDIFASVEDPAIEATLNQAASQAESFAATYRSTINVPGGPPADHLRTGLEQLETIYDTLGSPAAYAGLLFAADTRKDAHRALQQHVEVRATAIYNTLLFFSLEWLEVGDEDATQLMDDPLLAPYRHYLQSARRYKPHTLSEPEERMINEKDVTGMQAWRRFFTELNASISYPFEQDGTVQHLTLDAILARVRDPNREVRQQAHATLYATLATQSQTLAYIYNTLMLDHQTMDRLRHYPDPMIQRHLSNEIAPETVDTMMRVVEQNHDVAHRYFALKARLLNLPKLQIYDQYAPIGEERSTISYEEARTVVLEAFGTFSPTFRDTAALFFDGNWIDAEVRTGKQGGAFCSGHSPNAHPYVLCNYTDELRDAMTVAHELGHGIHFWLSRKQTLLNYYPTLPLAETASVFGEMLVFEHLLKHQDDPKTRLRLVCSKIEDIFATIFRQNVLTRFEQAAYAGRKEGRLTPEQLGNCWLEANSHYYGDVVEMTQGYEYGWSYIPHFIHTPFYCYSYVFGELLVLALYGMYREQGEAFVPRYIALLESGGSETPDDMLAKLGVDTRDSSFWQLGFNELRRLVDWAEELAQTP